LLLRLGGIEGWRTLETIRIGHHWLVLMFKLLLRLDGNEGWWTLETVPVGQHLLRFLEHGHHLFSLFVASCFVLDGHRQPFCSHSLDGVAEARAVDVGDKDVGF
jgi:hypothetical protein